MTFNDTTVVQRQIKFYNFKRFLACMILFTILSVMVLFPGNLSMPLIILVSAFHLCWCATVIDVVLFGDSVQSIDARVAAFQSFFQFGAGSHVLIAGPMKLDAGLAQQFLNVEPSSALTSFLGFTFCVCLCPSPCHNSVSSW